MYQIRSVIKKLCLAVTVLATLQAPAVVYNYYVFQHPETGNTIYLFSDVHVDLNDLSRSAMHVDALSKLFKDMPGPKEIIVEDKPTLDAETTKFTESGDFIGLTNITNTMPHGRSIHIVQAGTLPYATFSYAWQGIPVYNVEFRSSIKKDLNAAQPFIRSMIQNNDGPILTAYYEKIRKEYEEAQKTQKPSEKAVHELYKRLLDARILHRLYQNALAHIHNQIVLAGGRHISDIVVMLEQLGYEQKLFKGISNKEVLNILALAVLQAKKIAPTAWSSFLVRWGFGSQETLRNLEAIDKLYLNVMNYITLKADDFQLIRSFWKKPQKAEPAKAMIPIKSRL